MKNLKKIVSLVAALTLILTVSGFTCNSSSTEKETSTPKKEVQEKQTMNMFVTHGHCSTPFAGEVENLKLDFGQVRTDGGNPMENMRLSFEINPNTFNVCRGEEYTEMIRTPGLFIGKANKNMVFKSTNIYTMGMDWYQVNGILSIKGVEKEMKFFITGIRDSKSTMPTTLILEGRVNLSDWGIDYDKIVNGESNSTPTKWMHFNMKYNLN